jgi:hypothetical protein
MSQPEVRWRDLRNYCNNHPDYVIYSEGGDKFFAKIPSGEERGMRTVRIGHKHCQSVTARIPSGILSNIKRKFGITIKDILNG